MGYTVTYQESANNFVNTDQTIKGRQIPSIIFGDIADGKLTPDIPHDHAGQIYIGQNTGNQKVRMWVAAGAGLLGGWKEISIPDVPDGLVSRNTPNNYTDHEQTILGRQIVTVVQRDRSPDMHPPLTPAFIGQMYIDTSKSPIDLYISANGLSWEKLSDVYHTDSEVKLNYPNNFTDTNQTINGRPIVSCIVSSTEPSITPDYIGQIFFQYTPGASQKPRAKMWVASGTNTTADWKIVSDDTEIPDHVVVKNESNNFTNVEQFINHNQIMTMIDGAYTLPTKDTKLDFDGQLFITRKNSNVDDFAAWMGFKNALGQTKWLPIFHEGNLPQNVAVLDKSNTFDEPLQYIRDKENQPGEQTRIIGCRQLQDGDEVRNTKPVMLGEVILKQTPHNVADPDMGNQWQVHVGSSHRFGGFTKLANVEHPNLWHERQYMGDMTRAITGCRVIDNHPIENNEAPATAGEICIHKRNEGGKVYRDIYIARVAADANSWTKIFDGQYQLVANLEESNNFTNRHQYLGEYVDNNMAAYECIPGVRNVTTQVKGNITPTRRGEIVIQETDKGAGLTEFQTWMSVREGNKDAWTLISSSTIMI